VPWSGQLIDCFVSSWFTWAFALDLDCLNCFCLLLYLLSYLYEFYTPSQVILRGTYKNNNNNSNNSNNCFVILLFSLYLGRLFDRVDLIKPVSNVRLCVRTYVRTCVRLSVRKKFFPFQWNLACRWRSMSDARWYAVWPDPRSRSRALQIGNPAIFSSYLLCHLQWELATDHWLLN